MKTKRNSTSWYCSSRLAVRVIVCSSFSSCLCLWADALAVCYEHRQWLTESADKPPQTDRISCILLSERLEPVQRVKSSVLIKQLQDVGNACRWQGSPRMKRKTEKPVALLTHWEAVVCESCSSLVLLTHFVFSCHDVFNKVECLCRYM